MDKMVLLSISDIENLWNKKILVNNTPEYLRRYENYAFFAKNSPIPERIVAQTEFPRLIILLEFRRIIEKYNIRPEKLLMLNGGSEGDAELAFIVAKAIRFVEYDESTGANDMHNLVLDDKFDFVLFSQTLEHLYNPFLALRTLSESISPSGFVWTSVPTVNMQHSLPHNFLTGFTPIGLASLFAQSGFKIIEVGQWGNRKYINHVFKYRGWPTLFDLRRGFPRKLGLASLAKRLVRTCPSDFFLDGTRNEFDTPVQTWILAQKE